MTRVGINGFGRIGRLAARALRNHRELELAHVNELHADAATAAHLFEFDTVHGRYPGVVTSNGEAMSIDGNDVTFSRAATPADIDWSAAGVDIVIEASGKFKTVKTLKPHLKNGATSVIVAAPVKDDAVLNVVIGCNDDLYSPTTYPIATAASCTTNSIAPVVKTLHEAIGIKRGTLTTIHDVTNTQVIVDAPHKDLRRARSALNSLIPTTTGSATAVTMIVPELAGRLDGVAVRVPMLNASLTDLCLLYTSPSPRDRTRSRMPSSA